MIVAIAIGLQAGLLLGGRFKILSTVPVAFAAILVITMLAASGHVATGPAVLDIVLFCLSLQSGYMIMLLAGPRPQAVRISSFQA